MMLKRSILVAHALCAFGVFSFLVLRQHTALASGAGATTWRFPVAGVVLNDVHSEPRSDYDPVNHQNGPVYFIDCANVKNTSGKPLLGVELAFVLVDLGGTRIGPVLTFHAVPSENPRAGSTRSMCFDHGYAGGVSGQTLVGWVNTAVYGDGTHWSVAPAVAAIPSSPKSSGVRLSRVATYLPDESCTDVENISGKTITHVQLQFEYVNDRGSVLRKDALDVRQNLSDAQTWHHLCRRFEGSSDPDVFYYAEALSRGEIIAAVPKIFYGAQETRLVVGITTVNFSDGSEFHASRS